MSLRRIPPGPGQESVWDYPRSPRLEAPARHIQVMFNGVAITETRRAKRVLETSHPPVYYIPPEDIEMRYPVPTGHATWYEWKGQATAGWLLWRLDHQRCCGTVQGGTGNGGLVERFSCAPGSQHTPICHLAFPAKPVKPGF